MKRERRDTIGRTQGGSSYLDFANNAFEKLNMVREYSSSFQTPFMILDLNEAEKTLDLFEAHLPYAKIFYAMKANSEAALLNTVLARKCGIDVASLGEMDRASESGFSPSEIILTNPHKSPETLEIMFRRNIRLCTYDGPTELTKIANCKLKHGFTNTPQTLVRFQPELARFSRSDDPIEVQTDLSSKFGAAIEDIYGLVKMARDIGLPPDGLTYHIGSNCHRISNFVNNFKIAHDLMCRMNRELNLNMKIIDIGGGFPGSNNDGRVVGDLDNLYRQIGSSIASINKNKFEVIAEPGRAIAAPTGISVTTIIGIRNVRDKRWLILDDGLYGCFSPVYHDRARYLFFPVSAKHYDDSRASDLESYTVAGPTCDSFDTIAKDVYLPKDIGVGDQLVVFNNGAYTLDVRTKFNGFDFAQTIVHASNRRSAKSAA